MAVAANTNDLTTVMTTVPYEFDEGAVKHRLGLIALASDETTERDFRNMLPEGVAYYTSRVLNDPVVTIEKLREIGPRLALAAETILPDSRLDSIAYSCTSGTVALGYDEVASQIHEGRPGVPVVTPITSAIKGLGVMGVKKITLFTPYLDSVNQAMRGFLEDHGIEVLNIAGFGLEADIDMARLPPEAIRAAAVASCHPDADALFISCTAIRAVEILEAAEADLGKPVLSAIQTLFWESLRLSGYNGAIEGYGSLLRA
jgi:maleate isomerase